MWLILIRATLLVQSAVGCHPTRQQIISRIRMQIILRMRWLHQHLELLDSKLEEEGDDLHKQGGALHHLEEQWQILHANCDIYVPSNQQQQQNQTSEELRHERQLIQQQLNKAIHSLWVTSAAYASVIEFSSVSILHQEYGSGGIWHRHHLKQSSQNVEEHNEAIQIYNEYYRQSSKYE